MIFKIFVTFFLIILFLFFFRLINKFKFQNKKKKNEEKVVDLEKDPKTNQYKPKE
jgi:hypothetical protein